MEKQFSVIHHYYVSAIIYVAYYVLSHKNKQYASKKVEKLKIMQKVHDWI